MSKYLSSSKGFVFILELVIALLIFAGFVPLASIENNYYSTEMIQSNEKETLANAVHTLDLNGVFVSVFDSSITDDQKMDLIYSKFVSRLPQNYEARLEAKSFLESADCNENKTFAGCFAPATTFPSKGQSISTDKSVVHERIFIVKKSPPEQCSSAGYFSKTIQPKNQKLFFSAPKQKKLFFAAPDANTPFDVNTTITPSSSSINCDTLMRVDLNLKVKDANLAGRNYVDMMLVFNDSTSMKLKTTAIGEYPPATASGGTGGNCNNNNTLGGWISLPSINFTTLYDKKNYNNLVVVFTHSGYTPGICTYPKVRILKGAAEVDSNSSASPTYLTVNNFDQTATYTVQVWSDKTINYDVNVYLTKAFSTKATLINFLEYSQWQKSGNNGDYIGVASFNDDVIQNLQVAQAHADISKIQNLLFENATAPIGDGMHAASVELLSNQSSRPNAKNYQIVISDGTSSPGSYNAYNEAIYARDNNIIIYSVGVGYDVNDVGLKQISSITGGKYFALQDLNALSGLINQLATEITNNAIGTGNEVLIDSNIVIPALNCTYYSDLNGAVCFQNGDKNYLRYSVGGLNNGQIWTAHYSMTIPCKSTDACKITQLSLPPSDSNIFWVDSNLVSHVTDWNAHVVVNFLYRDLAVSIFDASIDAFDEVLLDVNAQNKGLLSTIISSIDFYVSSTFIDNNHVSDILALPSLRQESVTALSPSQFEIFLDRDLSQGGWIYAVINKDYTIPECPGNNIAYVYCTSSGETSYIVLDFYAWRK